MGPHAPAVRAIALLAAAAVAGGGGCRQGPGLRTPAPAGGYASAEGSGTAGAPRETLSVPPHSVELVQHEAPPGADAATRPLRLPEPIAVPAAARPTPVAPQPVEHYVSIALRDHPRVRAARARVAAASYRVPQARALEDPVLSNTFYPISDQALQTAAGRAGAGLSVSQKYPWPEKRRTKAAIAARETRMAAARLEQAELEVEEAVRLAYYELWFACRALEITDENRQVAAELVKLAEARNAAGGRQQDVLRAQLQVDSLDDRLVDLQKQKAVAQADLAALIQRPALAGLEPTDELDVADAPARLEALFSAAQECSPRLSEQRWAIARDRQKQRLAFLQRRPDFTLGAGWQTITESDAVSPVANGRDNVSFMVGVTLPIWRSRINAAIREASAEVVASSRELDAAQDDTFRQVRRFTEQAEAADQQLRLYEERILPRARRALRLAAADYRGQLVDFGEVADGFTEVLMFELQAARARATLAGLLAQLDRAVGCEVALEAR